MLNAKKLSALFLSSLVSAILIVLIVLLSACSPKEMTFFSKPLEKPALSLEMPAPITPHKIKWFIITPENADEVFKKIEAAGYDVVLFGLTDDGYEALSMNMAELRKYIFEQRKIIGAYKNYYEPNKKNEKEQKERNDN